MIHKYDGNKKTLCGLHSLTGSTLLNHRVDCKECAELSANKNKKEEVNKNV